MASHVLLPIEIWHAILRLLCTPFRPPRVGRLYTHVVPITASQVCREWRYFVINTPEFWTDISYVFSFNSYVPRPGPGLMHIFLERSADLPLTVNLDIEEHSAESQSDNHDLLVAIFSNLMRWQSATLFIMVKEIEGGLWEDLGSMDNSAPLLEKFELTVEPTEECDYSDMFPSFLWTSAPNLTKLAIELQLLEEHEDRELVECGEAEELFFSDWALTNGLPYNQLTHLMLNAGTHGDLTWREVAAILSVAQNLISCSLHGINGRVPSTSSPRITHQRLRDLDVEGPYDVDGNTNSTLLRALNRILTAPALQTLSLLYRDDLWDKKAYEDFINRSACRLEYLHFGLSPQTKYEHLLECISLTPPTLQLLHLKHAGVIMPEFSERMAEWDEEKGQFKLLPLLKYLVLDFSLPQSFSTLLDPMVDMLQSRACPPDGSPGYFTNLIISSAMKHALPALHHLAGEPYCIGVYVGNLGSRASTVFDMGMP